MDRIINNTDVLNKLVAELKDKSKKIVFTNGCFDIIHAGHVAYLNEAKQLGDILIVGINSDSSVKKLKGNSRPIVTEDDRSYIIANLKPVDFVVIFSDDTPYNLINEIKPDYLVKGSDYKNQEIAGSDIVKSYGGQVVLIDYVNGKSTTNIINNIKSAILSP
ncbi:MAG: D-glycero-beta-D-manno-heptose 1-phosphate adenylyltransferase [Candidatus Acididesulfobacter guangdongensis]|uniref:D-glycero-beta-D-manno-heptose 1-phosphate adenylyltransferase n=1 Tax=Acididesulfobacter guangdongensis TaxID=2597225 RepID=A0A519BFS7_ACIG2|nr:MAG: D-glycero-beta-D-manno-heptose 1-phosphate adenylyltransferase [Candidatus Acididesulfobacter guangdongensis]